MNDAASPPQPVAHPPEAPGMVWVAGSDDGRTPIVRGWIRITSTEPEEGLELGIQLASGGTRLVAFQEEAQPTPHASDGMFRFVWKPSQNLMATGETSLRFWRMDTGEELSGSPLILPKLAETRREPQALGEVPSLSRWPLGLAGEVATDTAAEIANGLWIQAGAPAQSVRFNLLDHPAAEADMPPRRGVRLMTMATTRHITAHFRPASLPSAGEVTEVWVQAWLPEATENNQQAHVEVWLTRRLHGGFEQLRRLRRSRIFRRPSRVNAELILTEDEAQEIDALQISFIVRDASGLSVLPPEISKAGVQPSQRMEDGGLERSFELLVEMVRLHGEAAITHPLLPVGSPSAEPRLPAQVRTSGHPPTEVIVPVYNGDLLVRDCIRSLREAATDDVRVLILDDGSRAFTLDMLAAEVAHDPRFTLRRRAENRGYTKSINEGVMLTSAPWVVILNSDTLVPKGWLDRLHAAAQARPGTGMAGPLSNAATWQSIPEAKARDGKWSTNDQIEPHQLEQVQALLARITERAYPEFPVLNGFCTLIGRQVFDRIGLYDEDAFPTGYGEETDLCLRARRAGFRLTVADDTFVYHHKSVSFGSANRSRLTRAGGFEMTNKHLGANIRVLEHMMQSCEAMVRLRSRMIDLLGELV